MPERKKQAFTVSFKQEAGRGWRINCTIDGKSHRPRFKTRASALQEKKRLLELHGNLGRSGGALLAESQEDAANALKILKPHSKTLTEAAQFYVGRYLKFSSNKTFNDYAVELVENLQRKRRKPKTILSLKDRTKAMLQTFGNTIPRDLPPEKFWSSYSNRARFCVSLDGFNTCLISYNKSMLGRREGVARSESLH